jgi:hypothetical protein
MKIYILGIIILLMMAACKKDSHQGQQGQITFTLNGANYTIPVNSSGDSIFSTITQGVQDNQILFGGHNGSTVAFIELDELLNNPSALGLDMNTYHSQGYDSLCGNLSPAAGCHFFNFMFVGDSFNVASYLDSAAILNVTSYNTGTHLMSGTFQGHVGDSYTLWLPLTNGKFTDVTFFMN